MVKNSKLPFFIVGITLLIIAVFIYIAVKHDQVCDEHVVLEDGTEYDCKEVNSYPNSMSCIRLCNGEHVNIPTYRIKIITKLKSE